MTRQLWRDHVNSDINSLDIDFIHGNIHGRSCKKQLEYSLPYFSACRRFRTVFIVPMASFKMITGNPWNLVALQILMVTLVWRWTTTLIKFPQWLQSISFLFHTSIHVPLLNNHGHGVKMHTGERLRLLLNKGQHHSHLSPTAPPQTCGVPNECSGTRS